MITHKTSHVNEQTIPMSSWRLVPSAKQATFNLHEMLGFTVIFAACKQWRGEWMAAAVFLAPDMQDNLVSIRRRARQRRHRWY